MKFIACAAMAAALLATPANARCFDVTGRVMVERAVTDRAGESHLVLEETADAAPGEALVFQFDYRNARPGVPKGSASPTPFPPRRALPAPKTRGRAIRATGGGGLGGG